MKRIQLRALGAVAALVGAAFLPMQTASAASTMTGYYFTLSNAPANQHPDVRGGIDGGVVTGLVQSALGPNGMPVVSASPYAGASGAITDVNPITGELLWWTAGRGGIVAAEKTQIDTVPFAFTSNFFADGQNSDASVFRAVHWTGAFSLAAPRSVTFTLAGDDDAWLFINGQLVVDDGGVKGLATQTSTATYGAGSYTVDVFFADRHQVQSGISFTSSEELTSVVPVPGALPLLASGLLLIGVGVRRKAVRA